MRTWGGLAIAGLLTASLAACGGDDEAAGDDDQVHIALLVGRAGENAVAIDDYANGAEMAVNEINANGGINGKDIDLKRFAPDVLDPSITVQAVQKAVEWNPTMMMGLEAVPQTRASLNQIARSEAPFLQVSSANLTPEDIATGGGKIFQLLPSDEHGVYPAIAAEYTVEDLEAKRVGIIYADISLGQNASAEIEKVIEELGGEVVEKRSYALDDTDLTAQVLAMKKAGVDAVVHWGYPNQLAVQVQQFVQNGMGDIPTVTSSIGTIIADNQLVKKPLLENLYAATFCNPTGDQAEWSAKYAEEFDGTASAYAAFMYDAVYIAKAAIEKAGTTDPDAIADALREVSYTDGVCLPEYKSVGDEQALSEHAIVVSLANGIATTERAE